MRGLMGVPGMRGMGDDATSASIAWSAFNAVVGAQNLQNAQAYYAQGMAYFNQVANPAAWADPTGQTTLTLADAQLRAADIVQNLSQGIPGGAGAQPISAQEVQQDAQQNFSMQQARAQQAAVLTPDQQRAASIEQQNIQAAQACVARGGTQAQCQAAYGALSPYTGIQGGQIYGPAQGLLSTIPGTTGLLGGQSDQNPGGGVLTNLWATGKDLPTSTASLWDQVKYPLMVGGAILGAIVVLPPILNLMETRARTKELQAA